MIRRSQRVLNSVAQGPESSQGSIADCIMNTGYALTVSELAQILNVSRGFLYRLAASGKVPYLRVGNAIRFDPKSVAAWLQKN
jgi:excisionase family DNA binding protein